MNSTRESLESGYFITEGVLTSHECEPLAGALAQASFGRGKAGSRHLISIPEVRSVASRMLRIARVALGTNALPYRATLFEKSRLANWLVVWHQDTALPLQSQFDLFGWGPWSRKAGILYAHAPSWALSRIVALRIHLDASTTDNGPLRVLPGTHSFGVISDAEVSALARSRTHINCIVQRGGVMAMSPLLVHSSSKARSDSPRRVLHIEYAEALVLAPGIQLAVA